MKKFILFLVIIVIQPAAWADESVVIKMADAIKNGSATVKPGGEYTVDLSGYIIPADAKLIILHVIDSPRSHYYYRKIQKDKNIYTLSAKDLNASSGSPPFQGLKKDASAFLIIGSEVQPGSINMGIVHNYDWITIRVQTE